MWAVVHDTDDLATTVAITAAEAFTAQADDRPTFTISAAAEPPVKAAAPSAGCSTLASWSAPPVTTPAPGPSRWTPS